MIGLRPFWRYYGAKWRIAPRYPAPRHRTIVEPFAGAAGYSLRYPDHEVILVERYHTIAEIWRYLIAVSADEILAIPEVDDIDDLPPWVPQAARWLVGFSMNSSASTPRRTLSAGRRQLRAMNRQFEGWTASLRARVASQVSSIRHWSVIEGDYTAAPDIEATWFVDSPYAGRPGSHYVHGSAKIDYPALARWCRNRGGQAIVCEADGATWLPFRSFGETRGVGATRSREAIWTLDSLHLSGGTP
jgi:hypothetical protein